MQTTDRYPFTNTTQRTQFTRLTTQLRCLVCQNENIDASNAKLANDLRAQVYRMVKTNKSDQQIKHYMVARYGDFVLFKPPLEQSTYALWFGPFLLLMAGLVVLGVAIKKQRARTTNLHDD